MAEDNKPTGSDDTAQTGTAEADQTTNQDNTSDDGTDFKAEYLRLKAQNEDIVKSRNKEKARRKEVEDRLNELEQQRRAGGRHFLSR